MTNARFGSLRARILTGRSIYQLTHAKGRYLDQDIKFIGVFSTKALAQETAKLLQKKPGFRSSTGKFHIAKLVIDQLGWSEGFGN